MKIGLISDLHYSTQELTCEIRRNNLSLGKLRRAIEYFRNENCDTVILLGDITDTEDSHAQEMENLRLVAKALDDFPGKIICLMGNHDAFVLTPDEFYSCIGEDRRPKFCRIDDAAFVFVDACYYASGIHYAPGGSNWEDTYYPHADDLATELAQSGTDAYVFMHQNIDPNIPENHRLSNDAEIRQVISQSGKVRAVFQGHYHPGKRSIVDSIRYITLPATCENDVMDAVMIFDTTKDR